MRKLLFLFIALMVCTPGYSGQWSKSNPAGTVNVSDIDTYIGNNNDALDRVLAGYRKGMAITYASVSTLTIPRGEVVVSNSGGTVRLMLRNTSSTTVTWADIDTGSEAVSTTYYVYAIAANTSSETATFKISASSSAPTGITYYAKLGSFYNNSSGNISYIENYNGVGYEWVAASDTSEGTSYSAGTTYQNITGHKVMVIYDVTHCSQGGWGGANVTGYIGETSTPATKVAAVDFDIADSGEISQSASFIVPEGWYWKITNATCTVASCTATVNRIEAFEFD